MLTSGHHTELCSVFVFCILLFNTDLCICASLFHNALFRRKESRRHGHAGTNQCHPHNGHGRWDSDGKIGKVQGGQQVSKGGRFHGEFDGKRATHVLGIKGFGAQIPNGTAEKVQQCGGQLQFEARAQNVRRSSRDGNADEDASDGDSDDGRERFNGIDEFWEFHIDGLVGNANE